MKKSQITGGSLWKDQKKRKNILHRNVTALRQYLRHLQMNLVSLKKWHLKSDHVLVALGLKYGMTTVGDTEKQRTADEYAKRFMNEFAKQNGSYLCRELLKCDLSNEEERQYAKEHGVIKAVCPKLIENAVIMAEQMMKESE